MVAVHLRLEGRMKCFFLLICLMYHASTTATAANETNTTAAPANGSSKWLTLNGDAPLVIARGGYSGVFPESSSFAWQSALSTGLSDLVLFCDLQLTKDGTGICHSDLRLENSTTIQSVYHEGEKTYNVNGQPVTGWFAVDFTMEEVLSKVSFKSDPNIFSRPSAFDGIMPLSLVEDVTGLRPAKFWINMEYPSFFKEHMQDPADFIIKASKVASIDYISSPESGYLTSIRGKVGRAKLIFRFFAADVIEPTSKQTYGTLLKDLPDVKTFASGILVPKEYIWPVGTDLYLQPPTTVVADAHKLGLEVYAYGFANDYPASYNYSYDPTTEYLQFIDNNKFAVDGVLTDFPSTASESVACLAHQKNASAPIKGRPLIISHFGASGDLPGCTDIAFHKAVEDGADIIDCFVQLTKDGVAFCARSIDMAVGTDAAKKFMSKAKLIHELKSVSGIFSFELTWTEVQTLQSTTDSSLAEDGMLRNPAMSNQGKFMTLSEFLDFAKEKKVPGILINIKNAAYLASKQALGIVDIVTSGLQKAGFDKQNTQQVLIQSDDSSVLSKFPIYKRVLEIEKSVSAAPKPVAEEIKKFADAVSVTRSSIVNNKDGFLTSSTDIADRMHAANLSVYVSYMRNEFIFLAFDSFADPIVEIATYISLGVDGIITEFPATAAKYLKSQCFNQENNMSYAILPSEPGALMHLAPPETLSPAKAPAPALATSDVIDPPLPPVAEKPEDEEGAPAPSKHHSGGQRQSSIGLCLYMVTTILSLIYLNHQ